MLNKKQFEQWKTLRKQRLKSNKHGVLFPEILAGNRQFLSRGITLLESNRPEDKVEAQKLVNACIKHAGNSIRVGITGVPGVGKSTFIEAFGQIVVEKKHKLAVLTVDPSSEKSGGSILGDKTRMNTLSINDNVFIRPSAAGKSLGGVAKKTRESIILCEAAGFDYILIETVGVGQSEIVVNSMVDFFMLLMLSGAGDELQGIKRGIMEMADALLITKADKDNFNKAKRAKKEYENALSLFSSNEKKWTTKVMTVSAYENYNIEKAYLIIDDFIKLTKKNGFFNSNRTQQDKYWLYETIISNLTTDFYSNNKVAEQLPKIEKEVLNGKLSPFEGAELLLQFYREIKN